MISRAVGYGEPRRVWPWIYLFLLLAINVYICREAFFTEVTEHWNSMHAQWMQLARLSSWHILGAAWWPYCFLGTPVHYVYAPLVPVLNAALSHVTGGSIPLAFHVLTGIVYCLGPVTLYLTSWLWARAPLCGFAGGLIYSLLSPTEWILPDDRLHWGAGLAARRMYLMFVWDDLPHLLSLALLPAAAWLMKRALESERLRDFVWPILVTAAMMLNSMFGLVYCLIVLLTVPLSLSRLRPVRFDLFARAAAAGTAAWLLICPWVPPSLLSIVRYNGEHVGELDTFPHSLEALVVVAFATLVVWLIVSQYVREGLVRWIALFACPAVLIPVMSSFRGPHFLPQPGRYKLEMELAIAWLAPFCLMPLVRRLPQYFRAALLLPLAAAILWQTASFRQSAIQMTTPVDVHASVEYRAARWLAANLPGQRVLMGGSIARGVNLYTDLPQLSGPYTTDENFVVELAWYTIKTGQNAGARDAEFSITWLRALGVQAVGVPGPRSPDFWKPFANPGKFDGVLPVLWREDDTTIYRVPQATTSLAHAIRPDQLVQRTPIHGLDTEEVQHYVAAINDPTAPPASFEWHGSNHALIRANIPAGDVISAQIDYDPGWHVRVSGAERTLRKDGLGMMAIDPKCAGECEITLDFDGGMEAKVTRTLSFATLIGLIGCVFVKTPFDKARPALHAEHTCL
jgi:hypothetical protein